MFNTTLSDDEKLEKAELRKSLCKEFVPMVRKLVKARLILMGTDDVGDLADAVYLEGAKVIITVVSHDPSAMRRRGE
jgi:hypothetical protein